MSEPNCPTCGPTTVEQHPRQPVTRCANCKEWLTSVPPAQHPAAPETRYPTGAIVPERQRCICDGVCLDHCRACNYSGRDLEEPCIADPDWEPDDDDLARREGLPAAPETETDANGPLTPAEMDRHGWRVEGMAGRMYSRAGVDEILRNRHAALVADLDAARERVRVVEGERDRYRSAWKSAATRAGIAADYAEANRRHAAAPVDGLCQTCGCGVDGDGDCPCGCIEEAERAREAFALGAAWALGDDEEAPAALRGRAESAEAAHRALQAAVEALADEWAEDYPGPTAACNRTPDEWARDLRALLAGGEER